MVDRVGERSHAPRLFPDQRSVRRDGGTRIGEDLRADLILDPEVEQQDKVIDGRGLRHGGGR